MGGLARSASASTRRAQQPAALRGSPAAGALLPPQRQSGRHHGFCSASDPSPRRETSARAPAASASATPAASAAAQPPAPSSSPSPSASAEPYPYPHVPVMLREVLDAFAPLHVTSYLDCTLGAGGHASEMVAAHPVRSRGLQQAGAC